MVLPRCSLAVCLVGCAPIAPAPAENLRASSPFVELAVEDHAPAVVSLPLGATARRPVIVVAHGAGDRGEWHCELWRRIVENRAFVLCPQGRRMDERVPRAEALYYYPDHFALEREVLAALSALERRYPRYVDASAAVYVGYSQGAIHGALVIALHADVFPRAVLIEGGNGGFREWSAPSASKYRAGGGQRVLFACGSPYCVRSAEGSRRLLEKAGVSARVVHAEGAGHSYGAVMEAELAASLAWVVEGDARWSEARGSRGNLMPIAPRDPPP